MGGSDDVIGGWILGIQNADRREAKISALESALHDTEQALAEKDREIRQIREHEFQRGYREGEAYMMTQAVRFAKHCVRLIPYNRVEHEEAIAFLKEHKS